MPKICGVATAVPPYRVDQHDAERFATQHFSGHLGDMQRMATVFKNAGIRTRYFSRPMDWLAQHHTMAERNAVYIESATELCRVATDRLLAAMNLTPEDLDYIVYVNTTGLATPSIDARLINLLKCRSNIRRTPIWGLGCAGGAAGLSHAYHYALGHPKERILVLAAELCGLTFLPRDYSRSNLVATALFGEGAAAALVVGDDVRMEGHLLVGTQSRFYPDSLDVMGWSVVAEGLQVVFAQRIPYIVAANASQDFAALLQAHDLDFNNVAGYILHPGGSKVLDAYRNALSLSNGELDTAAAILSEYGNMSSVTVLFVLERFLERHVRTNNAYALISALGPGFCSESLLMKA